MNFTKQNVSNYYLYDTQVENLFVSEYMVSAPGDYVKVYLYALMCAQSNQPLSNEGIAEQLQITLDKVDDAWKYWQGEGIVTLDEKGSDFGVEFVNLREVAFGRRNSGNSSAKKKAAALDDKVLGKLYTDIQAATGRFLAAKEMEGIALWISEYGIDPKVILYCYRYCSANRRSNSFSYVGAILKDWKAKGFNSIEALEEHLSENDKLQVMFKQVFRELGFARNATAEERRIMTSWFEEMKLSLDAVLEACKKTSGINSPNINYVNRILVSEQNEKKSEKKTSSVNLVAKVEQLYEKDREENEAKTNEMRAVIFSRIPRIKDIIDEQKNSGARISAAMLRGMSGRRLIAEEEQKFEALNKEKAELLVANGFSADATDTIYTCRSCKDTGFLEGGERCGCYDVKLKMLMSKADER